MPDPLAPRDPLSGDVDGDVATLGRLHQPVDGPFSQPNVIGWVPGPAVPAGPDSAIAMRHVMYDTVDEVGRVVAAEGIDCHWVNGGTVVAARSAAQLERAKATVALEGGYGATGVSTTNLPGGRSRT